MKKYLEVVADENDADYVSRRKEITDENLEKIIPIVEVIANYEDGYNWPNSEYMNETVEDTYKGVLTEEQIEMFEYYVPNNVHTIESVKLIYVEKEETLM